MRISQRRMVLGLVMLILVVTTFAADRAQAAALLLNGGFEDPLLAANSYVAGGGTNWSSTGTAFIISNDYGSFGNTPYGSEYLDLNTVGDADAQTVTGFVAGQSYLLTASFADLPGAANPVLTLSVSGAAVASGAFAGAVGGFYGNGTIAFQSVTLPFVAQTSGSATITLTNSSGASNNQYYPAIAVDNVGLSTVPEPTTSAALLVGTGVLTGWVMRRRRVPLA